mgnify:CR=1 FL=1
MPTFVETKEKSKDSTPSKHLEIDILANAKRMGLSFQELNLLSLQEYIWFAESYIGNDDEAKDATQDDIDRFYSTM